MRQEIELTPLSKLLATSNFPSTITSLLQFLGKRQWTIYSEFITLHCYIDLRKIRTDCGIAVYVEGKCSVSLIHGSPFCR